MVAHAESLHGHEVSCSEWALAPDSKSLQFDANGLLADRDWVQAVKQSDLLVLSIFNHQPQSMARRIVRRIRRHWPGARVVLCLWNAPAVAAAPEFARQTGAQACVTSLRELHLWVEAMQVGDPGERVIAAPIPDDDEQRVKMLHESGVLAPVLTALYRDTAKKAVNAFNTKWAQVSWVDAERVFAPGSLLPLSAQEGIQQGFPRDGTVCSYVVYEEEAIVVGDLARDPRFASDSVVHSLKLRFYAGVPLVDKKGNVLGCLSILDDEPRNMSDDELEVLSSMARQLMDDVREALKQGPVVEA
jgi:GAF domain-containing protein